MDVGHYAFAWRLPGVIAGALTVGGPVPARPGAVPRGARSRSSSGCSSLLDGMFFVQSRIAMNDVYVGLFILAAYLLFALAVARAAWRTPRAFWVADAGDRRAARPRARLEVGRRLRDRRARDPDPRCARALGRILLIVGLIGDHRRARAGWRSAVPPDGAGDRQPAVPADHDRADAGGGRRRPCTTRSPGRTTRCGSPSARPRSLGIAASRSARSRWARRGRLRRRRAASGSRRSTLGFALVVLGSLAYAAFAVAGRLGFGPLAPPPAARTTGAVPPPAVAAARGLAAARARASGLPAVWMVVLPARDPARRLRASRTCRGR